MKAPGPHAPEPAEPLIVNDESNPSLTRSQPLSPIFSSVLGGSRRSRVPVVFDLNTFDAPMIPIFFDNCIPRMRRPRPHRMTKGGFVSVRRQPNAPGIHHHPVVHEPQLSRLVRMPAQDERRVYSFTLLRHPFRRPSTDNTRVNALDQVDLIMLRRTVAKKYVL